MEATPLEPGTLGRQGTRGRLAQQVRGRQEARGKVLPAADPLALLPPRLPKLPALHLLRAGYNCMLQRFCIAAAARRGGRSQRWDEVRRRQAGKAPRSVYRSGKNVQSA
jgi:hypothetical protein